MGSYNFINKLKLLFIELSALTDINKNVLSFRSLKLRQKISKFSTRQLIIIDTLNLESRNFYKQYFQLYQSNLYTNKRCIKVFVMNL